MPGNPCPKTREQHGRRGLPAQAEFRIGRAAEIAVVVVAHRGVSFEARDDRNVHLGEERPYRARVIDDLEIAAVTRNVACLKQRIRVLG